MKVCIREIDPEHLFIFSSEISLNLTEQVALEYIDGCRVLIMDTGKGSGTVMFTSIGTCK